MLNITQIPAPRVPLLDPQTNLVTTPWFRFFNNLYGIVGATQGVIQIPNGGTGLSAYPTNGQLLIGNEAAGKYVLNTLTAGTGLSVTNGPGSITITNLGVTSLTAGVGISLTDTIGNITINNTGVLSFNAGTTGLTPSIATAGNVTLSGVLNVTNGGTGQSTYADGQLLIGNSTGNTLTKAVLTAGLGITVTNAPGAITIATNGTLITSAPVTKVANFTVAATDTWIINNKSGSTCVATLPSAATNTGRVLYFQNYQAQFLTSATSNVVPRAGGAATTAILSDMAGDTATLVSDGSNWVTMQYTPNNVLLI